MSPEPGFPNKIAWFVITGVMLCVFPATTVLALQQQDPASGTDSSLAPVVTKLAPVVALATRSAQDPVNQTTDKSEEDEEEEEEPDDLFDMDIEDLGKVDASPDPVFDTESLNNEVMSVDGTKSTVGHSPAAVYVLTEEMIRRSGVRNVPDALRLVPGVQVSRLNSQMTSITIRGFAGTFNNKVLVQVDGRSVYSQSYGGVFWDVQDMVLADIDRVEVIRGPGATVWGENAVNGVINIITKRTEDTLGSYFNGGFGDEENEFYSMSIGRSIGDLNFRVYGKFAERNPGFNLSPRANARGYGEDGGFFGRVGFRSDYLPTENDRITTTVDFHRGGEMQLFRQEEVYFTGNFPEQRFKTAGGFAMVNWNHKFCDHRDLNVRAYYDRADRDWVGTKEKQDTFELDIRHRRELSDRRERVVGLTGRYNKGRYFGTDFDLDFATFDLSIVDPYVQLDELSVYYGGGFIQEKWTLVEDKWYSWIGTKIGWNSFDGVNVQPSARTLFVLDEKSVVWGSISRAVRLPTRFDAGIQLEDVEVNFFSVPRTPDDQLISEEVTAYEMGYRRQPSERVSWELAMYYNDYENLIEEGPLVSYWGVGGPNGQLYRSTGQGYGAELNTDVKLADWWDFRGGVSYLNLEVEDDPSGFQYTGRRDEYSPDYMVYVQSNAQISPRLQWDATCRYVDRLHDQYLYDYNNFRWVSVGSYVQLDMRLNYQINDQLDFTVAGRNLLHSSHIEFGRDDIFRSQTRSNAVRGIFAQLTWKLGRKQTKEPAEKPNREVRTNGQQTSQAYQQWYNRFESSMQR